MRAVPLSRPRERERLTTTTGPYSAEIVATICCVVTIAFA